jgi:hypothetical protein
MWTQSEREKERCVKTVGLQRPERFLLIGRLGGRKGSWRRKLLN